MDEYLAIVLGLVFLCLSKSTRCGYSLEGKLVF